ncbi:glycosyltransferase family 4 protein [Ciceribacter sp. L1K23]|nr:glycosyltransferase family 4 protein [Ciceribacter sp. L1K23]
MSLDAVGGVWRYAMDLSASLAGQGFEFVFAGFGPEPALHQRLEAERWGQLLWCDAPLDWMASDAEALAEIPDILRRAIKDADADLVHLNLPSQAAGLQASVPILVMSHSCVPTWFGAVRGHAPPPDWRWHVDVNRRGLLNSDVAVAPSRSHATQLRRTYGIEALTVVHNASRASGEETNKHNYVAAVGRWWDDGKNGAVLDLAAPLLDWPVRLIGATEGPMGQRLALHHLMPAGERDHRETVAIVRNAAIFVSPSLYEPFGLAVLEAARTGAALVLADIPTYRELWGSNAVFFDPRDPGALAEAVNALSSDPVRRAELGARARVRSMAFSAQSQAVAMAALYRDLLRSNFDLKAAE